MDLLIVGAGGMGKEIFCWLSQEIKHKPKHRIIGFLDDNLHSLDNNSYPVKIVGTITDYQPKKNQSLVLAIMDPQIKKQVVTALLAKGADFYTLIHPSTIIGYNINIGKGCVIAPNSILSTDITVGDYVFLNTCVNIGHDGTIGHYSSINGRCGLGGNVSIGEGCFFGVGATIIPKRKIGNNAKIGAGSVVISHVPAGKTVFGNPAKIIT